MSEPGNALGKEPVEARLKSVKDLDGQQLRLPGHDPRFAPALDLPRLVVVRSKRSGRQEIVGAGWWGTSKTNPKQTAVEASVELVRTMERGGDDSIAGDLVLIRRARWWDIALYARGFWGPVGWAVLGALLAIAGAAVSFAMGEAPFGIGAAILALAVGVAIGKVASKVRDTARAR